MGPGGTILLRAVGIVVVVVAGVVVDVAGKVVVESELPVLDSVKLIVNAMSAMTTITPTRRAEPVRRQRQVVRGAAWRGFDMSQSYLSHFEIRGPQMLARLDSKFQNAWATRSTTSFP